ncbi:MAG TPA: 3-deoxy-D-manno-octulosonic acid transferase, partial [Candidatus Latescibacteria bacterium]|nr:3-deoxy-D-manno-octulosonic acid transferase [Candidatus Latescibacterota bacterium]
MYTFLWSIALPIGIPYLLLSGRGLRERLGLWREGLPTVPLWTHAASVGEVRAASAVVAWLRRQRPCLPVLFTTTSSTGRDLARRRWGCAHLAPLDHPMLVRKVLRNVRPRAVLLTEGELWPGIILEARRTGTPVA